MVLVKKSSVQPSGGGDGAGGDGAGEGGGCDGDGGGDGSGGRSGDGLWTNVSGGGGGGDDGGDGGGVDGDVVITVWEYWLSGVSKICVVCSESVRTNWWPALIGIEKFCASSGGASRQYGVEYSGEPFNEAENTTP